MGSKLATSSRSLSKLPSLPRDEDRVRSDSAASYISGLPVEGVLKSVIRIQRAFRLQRYVYQLFGPAMLFDSECNSSHGRIEFLEGPRHPASWIRVMGSSSPKRLVKLCDLYWGLPKPEVLITVTGGAQAFSLTPELQAALESGVAKLQAVNAWVITAGSDSGVMQLVGEAFAKQVRVPLPKLQPRPAHLSCHPVPPYRTCAFLSSVSSPGASPTVVSACKTQSARKSAMQHQPVRALAISDDPPNSLTYPGVVLRGARLQGRCASQPVSHALHPGRQREGRASRMGVGDLPAGGA